jgi:beta-glucosidase
LELRPGLVARLARIAAVVPLVVDVTLDRPAVLTPLLPFCAALAGTYDTGGPAYIAALPGAVRPRGTLPFDLPRSMQAVRDRQSDVPNDTRDPLFIMGHRVQRDG